jgi:hypothetical protein
VPQWIEAGPGEHLHDGDEYEQRAGDDDRKQQRSHHRPGLVAAPSSQSVSDSSRWLPVDPTCFCGTVGPFFMTWTSAIAWPRPRP